ncbi:MAG: SGNH/GDSL hydrolase family protein, partial [Planctomycetota bacterium]|nr:SGNH/GDSL hydrolase family protein [Planctomycetota bacterium]
MTETPEERSEDAPIQLSARKKLVFAGIATLLGLLVIEGTGRLIGYPSGAVRTLSKIGEMDRSTFDASVGMWRPNFKGHVSWPVEIAYDVAINKHGFRGPDFEMEKKKGSFRILCLGDSTTFSVYVKEGKTYPEVLQRELVKDRPLVEVINGGHPAWGTSDQLRFLKERAFKVKPDLVVHLFCGNDPSDIVDPAGAKGNYAKKLRQIDDG